MDLSPGFYEALPSNLKTTTRVALNHKITRRKKPCSKLKYRFYVEMRALLCLHWKYRISFYCFWSMKTSHFEHLPLFQFSVGEEGNGLQLFSEVLLLVAIGAVTTTQYLDTYVQNLWLPIRRLSALFHSFSSFFLPSPNKDFSYALKYQMKLFFLIVSQAYNQIVSSRFASRSLSSQARL